MKTINSNKIEEFVERYFDCPHCGALITDEGGSNFSGVFDKNGDEIVICEHCNKKIKIK